MVLEMTMLASSAPGLQTAPCSQCLHTQRDIVSLRLFRWGPDPSWGAPPSRPKAPPPSTFPSGVRASHRGLVGTQLLCLWHGVTWATLGPSQELPLRGCHCVGDGWVQSALQHAPGHGALSLCGSGGALCVDLASAVRSLMSRAVR